MNQGFLEYYRCPTSFANFQSTGGSAKAEGILQALSEQTIAEDGACYLPFDPTVTADLLRYDRYEDRSKKSGWKGHVRKAYYAFRPMLPVPVRRHLQKAWLKGWDKR